MTLQFFDGFQDGVLAPKPEWSGTAFESAQAGRDNSASGSVRGPDNGTRTYTLATPASTVVFGDAIRVPTISTSATVNSIHIKSGATTHLAVTIDTNGFVVLRMTSVSGTVLATATAQAFPASVWRQIQVKATIHATAGTCEIKVDGLTVINYSGPTGTATGQVTAIAFVCASGTTSAQWWHDDFWVCDTVDGTVTDGRPNNDFLGDLVVKTLLPSAVGDTTQWTPSTGANWSTVDEVPINTTDYVTAGAGLVDQYALADLPATAALIYGVRASAAALKTDAGSAGLKLGMKENSVVTNDDVAPSLTTTQASYYGPMRKLKPSNNGLFSVADVNAMQVSIEST